MKKIILLIILCCITYSCYESEPIVLGGKTRIFKLQDTITFCTDTFTLYGEHLGIVQDSSYIIINDSLRIESKECVTWMQSKIQIVIPLLPKYSTIYVVVNGKKVLYNNENYYQNIIVLPYPSFNSVLIPAGEFDMGSSEFEIANEQPIHKVILTKSFIASVCEINQRLYSAVMKDNPSFLKYNDYPVYNVTWLDAIKFCNRLSLMDSLEPVYEIIGDSNNVIFNQEASGWRLPTEAEWEYFADIKINNENTLLEYAWFSNNSSLNPHSIGTKKANKYGLYDVLGNVWEWCWDWFKEDYYNVSQMVNPVGPINATESRVIRGGSCDNGKVIVRKEYRGIYDNEAKIGFRIVRNNN